jgi:hypothetical protein
VTPEPTPNPTVYRAQRGRAAATTEPAEHAAVLTAMFRTELTDAHIELIQAVVVAIHTLDRLRVEPMLRRVAEQYRQMLTDGVLTRDAAEIAQARIEALDAALAALTQPQATERTDGPTNPAH